MWNWGSFNENITAYVWEVGTWHVRLQCLCCYDGPKLSWARVHGFSLRGLDLLNPHLGCTILKFSAYQNPLKELFKQSVPTFLPLTFGLICFQAFAVWNYPNVWQLSAMAALALLVCSSHAPVPVEVLFQDALQMGKYMGPHVLYAPFAYQNHCLDVRRHLKSVYPKPNPKHQYPNLPLNFPISGKGFKPNCVQYKT